MMLLRTRITVMVSAVAVTLIGALVAEGSLRTRWLRDEMEVVRISGQRSAWAALQQSTLRPFDELVRAAERDGALTGALARGDQAALAKAVRLLQERGGEATTLANVEVASADGRRLVGLGPGVSVLSEAMATLLRREGTPVSGLMRTGSGTLVLAAAAPLYSRSGFAGMVAVWTDAQLAVRELGAAVAADEALADADGAVRVASSPHLPLSRIEAVRGAKEGVRIINVDGRRFQIAWTAVPVLANDDSAKLVTMADITASERRNFWLLVVSEGAVLAGAAVFLAFLHWYMRRSFRPLHRVIQMLTALARGDHPAKPAGEMPIATSANDEIGQLAATAAGFRTGMEARDQLLKLRQDLDSAAAIQASILPLPMAGRPEFLLHSYMHPARDIGGDFYDFFDMPDGRLGVVIADVSGKGMGAALFMAVACTVIRTTARLLADPGECLTRANDLLAANNAASLFVTVFYGILCPRTGSFVYANGGHNAPYCLHGDGRISALPRTHGTLLGLFPGHVYATASLSLCPDDTLFLFTDGITEADDGTGTLFGTARLETALMACRREPEAAVESVLAAVDAFVLGAPQADDITCLAVRWSGEGNIQP